MKKIYHVRITKIDKKGKDKELLYIDTFTQKKEALKCLNYFFPIFCGYKKINVRARVVCYEQEPQIIIKEKIHFCENEEDL